MKYKLYSISCALLMLLSCTKKNTATSERFFFRNDGADLSVQVDGNIASKVFILLLHGGPGGSSSKYNSNYFSDRLEESYAMVYFDQRGNGASQGSYSQFDLTLEQNSKDIYALVRFLKKKYGEDISLFLMGHSWGGMTSTHALIHTDVQSELKGWIEIAGNYDYTRNNIEAVKLFLDEGNQQLSAGNHVDFWQELLDDVALIDTTAITAQDQSTLNYNGRLAEGKIADITVDPYSNSSEFGWSSDPEGGVVTFMNNISVNPLLNQQSANNSLSDQVHHIAIPSLFMWGKYDFIVPRAMGVYAHGNVGTVNKELVIFQHSGHFLMKNEPDLFVQEVSDFVELYK